MPSFKIDVKANGQISKSDDREVPGTYMVTILDVNDDDTKEKMASCALDAFHESVAIDMLDDFSISILDDNDHIVSEDKNHETYSYQGDSIVEKIGDFNLVFVPVSKAVSRPRM